MWLQLVPLVSAVPHSPAPTHLSGRLRSQAVHEVRHSRPREEVFAIVIYAQPHLV